MNISIDKKHGLLSMHKGFSSKEKFASNIVVGDVVLDISSAGRVRGVEILDLKRFLEDFTLNAQEILDNLTSASFDVAERSESVLITITFTTEQESFPARLAVSLNPVAA